MSSELDRHCEVSTKKTLRIQEYPAIAESYNKAKIKNEKYEKCFTKKIKERRLKVKEYIRIFA